MPYFTHFVMGAYSPFGSLPSELSSCLFKHRKLFLSFSFYTPLLLHIPDIGTKFIHAHQLAELAAPKLHLHPHYSLHFLKSTSSLKSGIMLQNRLNDAAIALHHILALANVHFGIFGGYAIGVMGGSCESKDIDCLASITKEQVIALLNGKDGFAVIPQTPQDYVAFLWSERADGRNAVLVEIFCEHFADKWNTAIPPFDTEHFIN
ncbi:hypothetical protein BDV19DRAFT_385467 [Aspergillus venezuelensis]